MKIANRTDRHSQALSARDDPLQCAGLIGSAQHVKM